MRTKDEILINAAKVIEKPITDVRNHLKLTILTLELLVDLRDELTAIKTAIATLGNPKLPSS